MPETAHRDKRCIARDADIYALFQQGATFPVILDQLSIPGISTQTLQRYVSECRKIEPERWPYRRKPRFRPGEGGCHC